MNKAILLLCIPLSLLGCGDDTSGTDGTGASTTSNAGGAGGTGNTGGSTTGGEGGMGASGGAPVGGGGTGGMGPFELTSTAFDDGGVFPFTHACNAPEFPGAMNTSPPLAWTAGPAGTMSYGIAFYDVTGGGFNHSAIWDIPASVFELPENVEKVAEPAVPAGAKQCRAYSNQFGYAGPCAPGFVGPRTYEFTIYAIGAATLPGITTDSDVDVVRQALEDNALEQTSLSGIITAE